MVIYLLAFTLFSLTFDEVKTHFNCEFDKCSSAEYCCAQDVCCAKRYPVWDLWYFWFTFFLIFIFFVCCCYYVKKRRSRRSNDVIVYSARSNTVSSVPYGHEVLYTPSQNTHYYMAPVMASPNTPFIGQGYPQAYIYPPQSTSGYKPAVVSSAPYLDEKS
ncbi:uncharacterized protein [Clytia hemisphaerica]